MRLTKTNLPIILFLIILSGLLITSLTISDNSLFFEHLTDMKEKDTLENSVISIHKTIVDHDGNLIFAGNVNRSGSIDLYLMKTTPDLNIIWVQMFGGSDDGDYIEELELDIENNIILGGSARSKDFQVTDNSQQLLTPVSTSFGFLMKFSSAGEILWSTLVTQNLFTEIDDLFIEGTAIYLAIKSGRTTDLTQQVIKYHPTGTLDNLIIIPDMGSAYSANNVVQQDIMILGYEGSKYIVTASTTPNLGTPGIAQESYGGGSSDGLIMKLDSNDQIVWTSYLGGDEFETIHDATLDQDGNLVLVGTTGSHNFPVDNGFRRTIPSGYTNVYFASKLDSDGNLVWSTYTSDTGPTMYNGTTVNTSVEVGTDNYITIIGITQSNEFPKVDPIDYFASGQDDFFLIHLQPDGDFDWSTMYGGSDREYIPSSTIFPEQLTSQGSINSVSLQLDSQNNIIISSTVNSKDYPLVNNQIEIFEFEKQLSTDIAVTKLSPDQEVIFSTLLPGTKDDVQTALVLDENDNIIITGISNSQDMFTIKPMREKFDTQVNINGIATKLDPQGKLIWHSYLVVDTSKEISTSRSNFIVLYILTLSISVSGYLVKLRYFSSKTLVALTKNVDKIISPLFNSNSSLIYMFMGQDVIKDKDVVSTFKSEVPKEIYDAKFLLNPVRLAMTKLLYENIEYETNELKNRLGLSWNEFNNNLNAMKKKDYVHLEQRFVEGRLSQFISLKPPVISQFRFLKEMLLNFLTTSHNIDRYMEVALDIKASEGDQDLYPN